jgi:hypothetical protein
MARLLAALLVGLGTVAFVAARGTPQASRPVTHPDLQGVWNFATITPLERPNRFAGKPVFTDAEARAFEEEAARQRLDPPSERKLGDVSEFGAGRGYNQFWRDPGSAVVATKRTSLVIDPPTGKLPPLTPTAEARRTERLERAARLDHPEDLNNASRCLVGFNSGPPMIPGAYNNFVQIVQTADHVVIFNEMAAPRIISMDGPMDGRPRGRVRQWLGESRGHWDRQTLVIETKNFSEKAAFMNVAGDNLHLIERITRLDRNTLLYRFTVSDSTVWTRPWTAELSMTRTDDLIYEFACHEGNYGMVNSLRGARAGAAK